MKSFLKIKSGQKLWYKSCRFSNKFEVKIAHTYFPSFGEDTLLKRRMAVCSNFMKVKNDNYSFKNWSDQTAIMICKSAYGNSISKHAKFWGIPILNVGDTHSHFLSKMEITPFQFGTIKLLYRFANLLISKRTNFLGIYI